MSVVMETAHMSGLADFATVLGEIEPPEGDLTDAHMQRFDALSGAAPFLPVRTAQDAALAVATVADDLSQIHAHDLTAAEVIARAEHAQRVLGRVAAWLTAQGGPTLRGPWLSIAAPERHSA